MIERPTPVLLGYRPRRPAPPPPNFGMPGVVAVCSASDCIVDPVIPRTPDWDVMNMAMHFDSPDEAKAAGQRAGGKGFEIHATALFPLVFERDRVYPMHFQLMKFHGGPCKVQPLGPSKSLGLDVVGISMASGYEYCTQESYLPLDCSPLSCNGEGATHPVNAWCLLDRWDDAVHAATEFARDVPEPGPFVIVEISRVRFGVRTFDTV